MKFAQNNHPTLLFGPMYLFIWHLRVVTFFKFSPSKFMIFSDLALRLNIFVVAITLLGILAIEFFFEKAILNYCTFLPPCT